MMRSYRLAGIALLAAAVIGGPARAQLPVTDSGAIANQVQELGRMLQQLQVMQQQYQQLTSFYQSFAHITDLNSAVSALGALGVRTPLPAESGTIGSLMSGTGSFSALGNIGSLAQGHLSQNQVYAPSGDDWNAQQLRSNASSIAGMQGLAEQLYQSAAARLGGLQELQNRLAVAQDPKDVLDLQARLQAEQAYIQTQQMQAQSLALWQQAQFQNVDQQRQERMRQNIDEVLGEAQAHGGW